MEGRKKEKAKGRQKGKQRIGRREKEKKVLKKWRHMQDPNLAHEGYWNSPSPSGGNRQTPILYIRHEGMYF